MSIEYKMSKKPRSVSEKAIEGSIVEALQYRGCKVVKMGKGGYPDRQVFYAPGRHFWLEIKNAEGTLTPTQKIRIPRLQEFGDTVYVVRSKDEAIKALEEMRNANS